jgi:hypothetical protein
VHHKRDRSIRSQTKSIRSQTNSSSTAISSFTAHHPVVDVRPPPSVQLRLRRRGPRSDFAIAKRCARTCPRRFRGQPPDSGLCQPKPELSDIPADFTILHVNLRGFLSHRAELEVHLGFHNCPAFVGITETLLDKSVHTITISGYELVSRLDRRTGQTGGGIALFARRDVSNFIVPCWRLFAS